MDYYISVSSIQKLISDLSFQGSHDILQADLGVAGLSGLMYVPAKTKNIPAVLFNHDWTLEPEDYEETLKYLASWGIAALCLGGGSGLKVDQEALVNNTAAAAEILRAVPLGSGLTRIDPSQVYVAGEGMGAGISILSANQAQAAGAISIYATETSPSAAKSVPEINTPGLILTPNRNLDLLGDINQELAENWGAQSGYGAVAREISKGSQHGFNENFWKRLFFSGGSQNKQRTLIRALMAGFVLAGTDKEYAAFRQHDAQVRNAPLADFSGSGKNNRGLMYQLSRARTARKTISTLNSLRK